jgi:hypothetical protein
MRLTRTAGPRLWLLAVVITTAGAPSTYAADAKLDRELERQAFIALPAVYEVNGDVFVESLTTQDGRRIAINQAIPLRGTSFGVAPGRVVTARHLIAPPRERIFDDLAQRGTPRLPTTLAEITSFAVRRPKTVRLTHASNEATAIDCRSAGPKEVTARVGVETTDPNDDLVLLEIDAVDAPALALADGQPGTSVAVIGFGGQASATPSPRPGTLGTLGDANNFEILDANVVRGDSGGPVIGRDGRSNGVVLRREVDDREPVIARATSVRNLLQIDKANNAESATTAAFRTAMTAFWNRDYSDAEARLATLAALVPDSDVIGCQRQLATKLKNADYTISGPSRTRTAILVLGAMATLAAAIFGLLRVARHPLE